MKTICLGVRIPKNLLEDLERAREITGALSYSDLIRDALRAYLLDLSISSHRADRIKAGIAKGEEAEDGAKHRPT